MGEYTMQVEQDFGRIVAFVGIFLAFALPIAVGALGLAIAELRLRARRNTHSTAR
jgi:hypothetical protein